ncbi:sn-glycerol-3-phosphate ABC transporter ATP-binding protein UgpC [Bradyrhizobium genosp. L]|uniref:ABC transporter ATP-binding protein n=1 Tax=Bradyrhizobium genosp. L TaxID=83637 RepID=UPI0018A32D40|nr:sn-glycerol-3-phosphate ABC transporter ATP-binding protein UgpC [Bradyrhizobium genosp. L]QPF83143.1 sn-glycerol-3-phosphate ABC transporter ATP-binding protein UgpC [Bradyrhizobium genosp. L]
MAHVEIENVSKAYGPYTIIEGLDLNVADEEFVVLVGPSGCGKTTTLRMIAGLETVSSGTIRIGNRDVTQLRPGLRNCAMVFQNYALYPHMTVGENIGYGMKVRGEPRAGIEKAVKDVARVLDLEQYLDRRPKQLSGGQRQRVAIGRAIVRSPDVFLFDEPLSNLDAKLRIEMRTEIKALHRRLAKTIVYVTHDQVEAMTMADRVVVMNKGRIEQAADPITIYEKPANLFVAGFIGAPSMNFIHGEIVARDGGLVFTVPSGIVLKLPKSREAAWAQSTGKPVVLGVRPDHVLQHGAPAGSSIRMTVRDVEPLGPHTLVIGTVSDFPFTAQMQVGVTAVPDQPFDVGIDLERVHLFDKSSGKAIS